MDFQNNIKSFTPIEITLLIIFILFIIMPVQIPVFIGPIVNSPLGILCIFTITLFLFLYSNPILAIVYIFVGYELIRRTSAHESFTDYNNNNNVIVQTIDNNVTKPDVPLLKPEGISSAVGDVLEHDIINTMVPTPSTTPTSNFIQTSFKPLLQSIGTASDF